MPPGSRQGPLAWRISRRGRNPGLSRKSVRERGGIPEDPPPSRGAPGDLARPAAVLGTPALTGPNAALLVGNCHKSLCKGHLSSAGSDLHVSQTANRQRQDPP
jgi:hypothetical protein